MHSMPNTSPASWPIITLYQEKIKTLQPVSLYRHRVNPEYLGYLVGHLGGPLAPGKQSINAMCKRHKDILVAAYQCSMMRDGNASRPSLNRAYDEH